MSLPTFAERTGFDASAPYGRDAEGRAYTTGPDITGKGGGDYPNPNIRTAVPTMSQTTTGAQASTSGAFSGLLDKVVTAGTSLYTAKLQADAAKTAAQNPAASPSPAPAPAADWRGTVATGSGITSQPWFPLAVIAGVVVLGGGLLFALLKKGGK